MSDTASFDPKSYSFKLGWKFISGFPTVRPQLRGKILASYHADKRRSLVWAKINRKNRRSGLGKIVKFKAWVLPSQICLKIHFQVLNYAFNSDTEYMLPITLTIKVCILAKFMENPPNPDEEISSIFDLISYPLSALLES